MVNKKSSPSFLYISYQNWYYLKSASENLAFDSNHGVIKSSVIHLNHQLDRRKQDIFNMYITILLKIKPFGVYPKGPTNYTSNIRQYKHHCNSDIKDEHSRFYL